MTDIAKIAAGLWKRLTCLVLGHSWERRIIVPGQYCQAVTLVCGRCGSGEEHYRKALGYYRAHIQENTDAA